MKNMHKVYLEDLIVRQEGFPRFTRELMEKHQLELLNVQLQRAKAVSPFYKDYPQKLTSLNDLKSLPFTTSQMLTESFSVLCLSAQEEISRIRTEYTSGTLGNPKKVAYSEYDSQRTVEFFANGLAELIFPDDRVIVCFPHTDSQSLGGLIAKAVREIGAHPILPGLDKTFGQYMDIIRENEASVYLGPPVLLLSLLRLSGETTLKRALVSGDRCSGTVMKECEKLLGAKLFPHYGLRESGLGCAYTCSAHEGMHVRENDVICEIVNERGDVLPRGEWGELVISTAGLEAMPLFRYKTGDFARILPDICPCGSAVTRIEVAGRISRTVQIGHFDDLLFGFDDIIDFNIRENSAIIFVKNKSDGLYTSLLKLLRGFDVELIPVKLSDKPMYTGKRRIL